MVLTFTTFHLGVISYVRSMFSKGFRGYHILQYTVVDVPNTYILRNMDLPLNKHKRYFVHNTTAISNTLVQWFIIEYFSFCRFNALHIEIEITVVKTHEYPVTLPMFRLGQMSRLNARYPPIRCTGTSRHVQRRSVIYDRVKLFATLPLVELVFWYLSHVSLLLCFHNHSR